MSLKSKLALGVASLAFSATMSFAAITADELSAQYQAQGYSYISIKSGPAQIKVEAVKDGQRVEVVYDIATGAQVKSSHYQVGTIVSSDPGVRIREVPRDFTRRQAGSDDDYSGSRDDDDDYGSDDHKSDRGDDDHGKRKKGDDHGKKEKRDDHDD